MSARSLVDGAVALEWLAVSAYFIQRYLKHRRLVSLGLAAMACGWVLVALRSTLPVPDPWGTVSAAMLGVFVWYAIIRVERTGR